MKKFWILFFGVLLSSGTVWAATAKAFIDGTAPDSKISGTVTLQDTTGGLLVEVHVQNAPPGLHGFHIHEKGDCAEMGDAAGGHYNPLGVKHGLVTKDGFSGAHAGDFGNMEVDRNGLGVLKIVIPELKVKDGPYPVNGRAVILHEKKDDFGQPTGNAGGRIACGVIQAD